MIDAVLTFLQQRLEDHLKPVSGSEERQVCVSPLVDEDGNPVAETRNRLVLLVINIIEDSDRTAKLSPQPGAQDHLAQDPRLNIHVMLASGYTSDAYTAGLKALSSAMDFFRSNPEFSESRWPDFPGGIAHLGIEPANFDPDGSAAVWATLGRSYVPSVIYRLRWAEPANPESGRPISPIESF